MKNLKKKKKEFQLIYPLKHFLKNFSQLWIDSLLINKKKIRYNNNLFMIKQLRKEIMVRLSNEFNKSQTPENWKKYKQQRNKCISVLKGTKTNYFNNLNPKVITDYKKFWSTVKPLFSDKSKAMNTIVLHEKGKVIKNYKRVSEVLNKYFRNLTKSLKIKKCISRNKSIKKINPSYPKTEPSSFREIRETETLEIIESLPKNTANVFKYIPMRIIKDKAHVYSHRLTIIFNNCIKNSKFPDILKYADITPVFKKGDTTDKSNYRPISTRKYLRNLFIAKSIHTWSLNFPNT